MSIHRGQFDTPPRPSPNTRPLIQNNLLPTCPADPRRSRGPRRGRGPSRRTSGGPQAGRRQQHTCTTRSDTQASRDLSGTPLLGPIRPPPLARTRRRTPRASRPGTRRTPPAAPRGPRRTHRPRRPGTRRGRPGSRRKHRRTHRPPCPGSRRKHRRTHRPPCPGSRRARPGSPRSRRTSAAGGTLKDNTPKPHKPPGNSLPTQHHAGDS